MPDNIDQKFRVENKSFWAQKLICRKMLYASKTAKV